GFEPKGFEPKGFEPKGFEPKGFERIGFGAAAVDFECVLLLQPRMVQRQSSLQLRFMFKMGPWSPF
ncbi:MAG: hypothetical protein OSA98_13760, partial [Rubripirellula sp.]|nr:hypothetical protein [Rubripirellula sp.]